jgi:CheY-like chemotaxis protein
MKDCTVRRIRKSDQEVTALLDHLDRRAERESSDARRATRHLYRLPKLIVELEGDSEQPMRLTACSRNMSSGGLSFLAGQFIYPGTGCRVSLPSIQNRMQIVRGRITRCRYIEGTGSVHEVGVRFEQPVDVSLFHPGVRPLRTLLAESNPPLQKMAVRLLLAAGTDVTCVEDGQSAADAVLREPFGLILLDLGLPVRDGLSAAREIRRRGCLRHLVALAQDDTSERRKECIEAGFDDMLCKPLSREVVLEAVRKASPEPVLSKQAAEPTLHDAIGAFAQGTGARVTALEAAFGAAQLDQLSAQAATLCDEATTCGFEPITRTATQLKAEIAAAELSNPDAVRGTLRELVRLCLAVRFMT